MAINVFTVVSEFKFDVAGAILGTETLQKKVDGLSESVGNAINNVGMLGMGFVANFSGAAGGILGLLGNALSTSDKFTQSQLSFVQIIDSNMAHLSGSIGTMNEKMLVSRKIMGDIAGDANKFGLPARELLGVTKTLSAMLVPKGLAGENFGAARSMSRNLLKSAPNLGIDPSMVQGQLLRAIEGSASMGDTLFRRLISEAPEPFQAAKVKDAKGFNALKAAERFNILNDSLMKFAKNSDILEMRANTLSGTMQTVRDLFTSFNSVLKPLGDVILPLIVEVIQIGIDYLNTDGRKFIESFAVFLKSFIKAPKEMMLDMFALQDLAGNVAKSAGFVSLIVGLTHFQLIVNSLTGIPLLGAVAGFFGGILNFFLRLPIIGGLISGFMGVFKIQEATGAIGLLKVVGITLFRMIGLFGIMLVPIVALGRAIRRMKLDSVVWLARNMSDLMDTITSLRMSFAKIMAPIMDMITGWEELFYTIFSGTFLLDGAKGVFTGVADGIAFVADSLLSFYADFRGVFAGVFGMIFTAVQNLKVIIDNISGGNIMNPLKGTDNIFEAFTRDRSEEFMKTMNRFRTPTLSPDGTDGASVSNQVNNYDVTMNNSFKEVLQPDRIAFTIQEQLEKASTNRRSSLPSSIGAQQARGIQ